MLEDLRGLHFRNKIGAAFGSYGWSGESVGLLEEHLAAAGVALAAPGLKASWQPAQADLEKCEALGASLGAQVMKG